MRHDTRAGCKPKGACTCECEGLDGAEFEPEDLEKPHRDDDHRRDGVQRRVANDQVANERKDCAQR